MGENQMPATLQAMDIWRHELVNRYMACLGVDLEFSFDRDHGSFDFEFPEVGNLRLHGYFLIDRRDKKRARTICVLAIDDDGFSRVTWDSDKGWLYSMMGGENEGYIPQRAQKFLREMNQKLGTDFGVGRDVPIDVGVARSIIGHHMEAILAARRSK
jgi:hypothetical protein